MKFAIIENKKVINTIITLKNIGEEMNAIYIGDLPIGIDDEFVNNQFIKTDYFGEKTYYDIPPYPDAESGPTQEELSEALNILLGGRDDELDNIISSYGA